MKGTVHMTPAINGPWSLADYSETEAKILKFQ